MTHTEHTKKEPLFHIIKRDNLSFPKKAFFYAVAIALSILVGGIVCSLFTTKELGVSDFFGFLYEGAFGTERRTSILFQDMALLLGVSLALVPAFKMKFWNLGGNGQILMGCLAYVASMYYLGAPGPDGVQLASDEVIMLVGIVGGVVAGAVWALIPAVFKAFFNTNESLFTLMMNYIAAGIVSTCIAAWVKGGSGVLPPQKVGKIPEINDDKYLLTILVFLALAVVMYIYLKYSKHGYELSVVGESSNTAKYIGINVKSVIIRTLALSGAMAGLVGVFLGGAVNHTIATSTAQNMGFTAIMTSWLAAFNPLGMALSCFFITFVSKGMGMVRPKFGFTNDAIANIVIGIIYFAVIAVSFFSSYRVVFREGSYVGRAINATGSFVDYLEGVVGRFTAKVLGYVKKYLAVAANAVKRFAVKIFGKAKDFLKGVFTKKKNDKEGRK